MVKLNRITRKKLGELLLEEGIISKEDIDNILAEQEKSGEMFGEILVRMDFATEEDVAMCMVSQFSLPYIDVTQYKIDPKLVKMFPIKSMLENIYIPLGEVGNVITIAISGPVGKKVLKDLETIAGKDIQIFISTVSKIRETIEKVFS